MIVTVTLNPALDLTYAVAALVPHGTHRVTTVLERPGGKGLNVARVLHRLGEPVLATGFLGGPTGRRTAELLASEGVPSSFVDIAGETRRTIAVIDPADATGFWEPGPAITPAEWARFVSHFRSLLPRADVVTLSGSLPPGLPPAAYATLIALARDQRLPTILDTSGPALSAALAAGPTVIKPNADELAGVLTLPAVRDQTPPRNWVGPANQTATTISAHDPQPSPASGCHPQAPPADRSAGDQTPPVHWVGPANQPDPTTSPRYPQAARGDEELVGRIRDLGADAVVLSRGAEGLLAVTVDEAWRGTPPEQVDGNPTGAGDACVAAIARGLRNRDPWPELLADALALGAATVATPTAGSFDHELYRRLRPGAKITTIEGAPRVRTHR